MKYSSVTELVADNPNLAEYMAQLEGNLKCLTQVLDDIACDYEHMKRKDMVEKAGDALCRVGAWRKARPGEFCRGGKSYGFPGRETPSIPTSQP